MKKPYFDLMWINKAIEMVANGSTDKMVKDSATVYKVKNIVRIDIKTSEV